MHSFERTNSPPQKHWSLWGATCHGKMKFPTASKFNAGARKTDYTSKFVLLIF